MKRFLSLFALLFALCVGTWADDAKVITTEASAADAGTRLTVAQLTELFNTGKHFAFVNTNGSARGWHTFGNLRSQELTTDQLYTVTIGSAANYWYVKNFAGETLTQANPQVTFAADGAGFDWLIPQDGGSSMYDNDCQFRFQNTQAKNYRVEYKDFGDFAGDWAHYVAYGPFYVVNVEAKCGEKVLGTYTGAICTQGTLNFNAPEIEGYFATQPSQQVEVNGDMTVTIEYSSYNSGDPSDVNLTPWPTSMRVFDNTFTLPDVYAVNIEGVDAAIKDSINTEVTRFIAQIKKTTGKIGNISDEPSIIMLTQNNALGDEGYVLNITESGIAIEAKTATGFYYGMLSVQKMMPSHVIAGVEAEGEVDYAIPCVQIQDDPRFEYRGFMLDCSRHFFEVEELKRMLDVMAIYKMNYFHWHLTDDQGWRAEIKKWPNLTIAGATAPDCRITDFENGTYWLGHQYGPFSYSQDDMREIVRYAAERHIEVIPEIEMLGHSVAALVAYPQFSCNPSANRQVWTNGGVSTDVVNVADPAAVQFYKDIVDELCPIFTGRYFHIGGDECPTTAWEKNALCQQFLQEKGFDNYRKIQSWFTNEITGYLKNKWNKTTIVWNESITAGGSDLNLVAEHKPVIMCWYPAQGGSQKAATLGLDAIITEYHGSAASASGAGGYYINRKLSNHPSELDGAGAGDDTVEGCYKYVPVQGSNTNVIGVQGTFWCEWVGVPEYLEYLALPRLFAVAEAGWTPQNRKDWDSFVDRMVIDTKILDYGDYTYSQHWMPGYVPPKIETVDIIADGMTEYTFNNQSKDRPTALADNNGTLNGQASECTSFVLEPAPAEGTYYIKSTVSGKYLYASGSADNTMVTLSNSKSAWSFDWETMPKYVAICLADAPAKALNNNVNNNTKVRLFAHGASNGASFYTMTLTKEADPSAVVSVETAIATPATQYFDAQGRTLAPNAKGLMIGKGTKIYK